MKAARAPLLALVLGLAAHLCAAAEFPQRAVQVVVPAAPGSPPDYLVRLIAPKLSSGLGQPVVVDNRPGGLGGTGATHVAKSRPDGYTVLYASVGSLCIIPRIVPGIAYDTLRDFDAVTLGARAPAVLVVNPQFPARTLAEFIAYAKANPGKVSFGTAGEGSPQHVIALHLQELAGISMTHVPYKSGIQAMNDVIGGDLHAAVEITGVAATNVLSGRVRALVVGADKRIALLPEVPAAPEAGLPGFNLAAWGGFLVPAGTPPDVIARLGADLGAALNQPEVKAEAARSGSEILASSPRDFTAYVRADCGRWSALMERARK